MFDILSVTGLKKVEDCDRWVDSFLVQESNTIQKISVILISLRFVLEIDHHLHGAIPLFFNVLIGLQVGLKTEML